MATSVMVTMCEESGEIQPTSTSSPACHSRLSQASKSSGFAPFGELFGRFVRIAPSLAAPLSASQTLVSILPAPNVLST